MSWKLTPTASGLAMGIVTTILFYSFVLHSLSSGRAEYVQPSWSSEGREWSEFANWLRHGGRKLVMDGAFTAARNGLSEAEVRNTFGPPDLVVVGSQELEKFPAANMRGLGAYGLYIYKVGTFAHPPTKQIYSELFYIVFDRAGNVVFVMGGSGSNYEAVADIETDTRSDRRIASARQ
ncbi:MAG: hypothetical protein R3D51_17665 [Hyphomicrobiaceae bacterium]